MNANIILCLALALVGTCWADDGDDTFQGRAMSFCRAGQYACKNSIGRCVAFEQLCNGEVDCPYSDDEENELCQAKTKLVELEESIKNNNHSNNKDDSVENDFSGTGFMFSVNNLVIEGGSNVKMFNQNSDNQQSQANDELEAKSGLVPSA